MLKYLKYIDFYIKGKSFIWYDPDSVYLLERFRIRVNSGRIRNPGVSNKGNRHEWLSSLRE